MSSSTSSCSASRCHGKLSSPIDRILKQITRLVLLAQKLRIVAIERIIAVDVS